MAGHLSDLHYQCIRENPAKHKALCLLAAIMVSAKGIGGSLLDSRGSQHLHHSLKLRVHRTSRFMAAYIAVLANYRQVKMGFLRCAKAYHSSFRPLILRVTGKTDAPARSTHIVRVKSPANHVTGASTVTRCPIPFCVISKPSLRPRKPCSIGNRS
ncbi:hypothetical protein SODALDRAFT_93180 [Sodiomyces alkalinus F11]|uniref:Uncharacterized protein n=1 Tax=Sodiomyces alkalinus (strain CBS 110278 / VKM F-3762 / F11) TaxID=1314773 RepID=A0A3N2Q0K0_SODAK|nr:hypothetical protein SODALDRAFT_93180 [Sodiomyces alkalinus F11]ROT40294.1 hypothetical protein SODALDRAFT_93180 [Sodiomyces alkalinus F11]